MKIIFLDIDGVLNHRKCKVKTKRGFYFVDDKCIVRLKKIIEKTEAKVVLSSTWRYGYYDLVDGKKTSAAKDYEALMNKLQEHGIFIYGHTPVLQKSHRGTEILNWLKDTDAMLDSFVILDDGDDIYPLEKYHVRTSFKEGLRWRHVGETVRKLNTGIV